LSIKHDATSLRHPRTLESVPDCSHLSLLRSMSRRGREARHPLSFELRVNTSVVLTAPRPVEPIGKFILSQFIRIQ